jgi:hypothetical protein
MTCKKEDGNKPTSLYFVLQQNKINYIYGSVSMEVENNACSRVLAIELDGIG